MQMQPVDGCIQHTACWAAASTNCACVVIVPACLQGFPVQLPTFVARMLAFKLSIDSSKLPAVGDLLRSMARWGHA